MTHWNQEQVDNYLLQQQITRKFQTPYAKRACGVWECLVRSVKKTLEALLGEASVTDDVQQTVFVDVDRILNSRPLTPVSDDPSDCEALTPNHFLIQQPNVSLPPSIFTNSDAYRHK
jgi:hypothetical protein